ncbi:SDR family NAD(P)-dependent oxidoreductase [Frigidibacter sp. MR17.14]|uniref:SDR family NAD(P)-dependent oxidoreductase n=1 Tax=Frigidibacter sp. MR17.14 TaxID=3126509 RepID=UPI003012F444
MLSAPVLTHRSRQLLARSIHVARRVMRELRTPSQTERLLAALPVVAGAAPGLADKVVVITGGTQGVGLAVARRFGALGARVVVNARRPEALGQALALLAREGVTAQGVLADVATPEGAERLVAETVATQGRLDILINNAAIAGPHAPIGETAAGDLLGTMAANLEGPLLCANAALRWFRANAHPGRILNVSSIATEGSYPKMVPYSTSKAALEAFTRHAASDLPGAEVVVTGLILPAVQTERKRAADWASTELLPPVETILPAFEFAATGPAAQLHGRSLSAARFLVDAGAEARLAGVAAIRQPILYPELTLGGQVVARDPQALVLLDRAENQQGTSPRAIAAVVESLTAHPPNFYPEERYLSLRGALAEEHGLTPDHFALGPGSWELIARILSLFAAPGEEIVSSGPGWFGFNVTCERHGIRQRLVPFERGGSGRAPGHGLDRMLAAITPRTRLVYLISPSNPEGVVLRHAELAEFLAALPETLPVMIDEAYAEFADDPAMADVPALVRQSGRSVIGLRTFSKFHALAGMRVGYAYAAPELAGLIRRSEQIFMLPHVSAVAAEAALRDHAHRDRVHAAATAARAHLQAGLAALGIAHIPSQAPYVFAATPKGFDAALEALKQEGIVVPPYKFNGGASVMLPVGTVAQIDRILAALGRQA